MYMLSGNTRRSSALLIMLLGILWSGCQKQEGIQAPNAENHSIYKNYTFSNDEKVIEIGAPTPWATVNHIIEVMKRDEILREELGRTGYTVKYYPFLKGDDIIPFITNGALEGAVTGDMPTLKMASTGKVAVMSLFHTGSVSLVSRDVYRVRDLKNKRVAYPYGANAHYYLLRLLKEKGLSDTDIRHVPMNTNGMLEAIQQDRIDAFTTFDPTATVYTRIDPTLHTISRSFSSYSFFSLRKDYAVKHPRAAQAVLAAQFRAMAWLKESDRNLNRASRWVAAESEKIVSLPLNRYIAELDALCAEDLSGNSIDYASVMDRAVLGDNGDIHREFEFLKTKGFFPRDREWKEIKNDFDMRSVQAVLKNMKPLVSRVRP